MGYILLAGIPCLASVGKDELQKFDVPGSGDTEGDPHLLRGEGKGDGGAIMGEGVWEVDNEWNVSLNKPFPPQVVFCVLSSEKQTKAVLFLLLLYIKSVPNMISFSSRQES